MPGTPKSSEWSTPPPSGLPRRSWIAEQTKTLCSPRPSETPAGKRSTAAIAMAAYPEDDTLEVVRLDGLQRGNAGVGSGEHV
ncbi:MAG: hypothetical protein HC897_10895, partial [Thermoanaerobaculia bacterium]|nr:hypothetical protein [Thermoanaerobaculia bacterium]